MLAALALVLAIAPHAIKAHIDFLSADVLEGRETGTRGMTSPPRSTSITRPTTSANSRSFVRLFQA